MDTSSAFHSRRQVLGLAAGATIGAIAPKVSLGVGSAAESTIEIDPTPTYELSPHLYMQFMEPLGTNDSSVEASWDHLRDRWRPELIDVVRSLSPAMLRWGGLFSSYYHWREGVGPRQSRVPMNNIAWGGIESNQVGTAEFVDFCRQVGADPLICVNFESEGRAQFEKAKSSIRRGDAKEAADWVAYCNQADNELRRSHGISKPLSIKYWQIGNETSYSSRGFDVETAARKTLQFAGAMRQSDPSIRIIGWGDSGWGPRMAEVAGEQLQYLAFHHMFNPDDQDHPILAGEGYRKDPLATWQILNEAWKINDAKIRKVRESVKATAIPLAMTECHFSIPGNNRNDVLRSWTAGVSYARILNNHQRHGDVLKIATSADFCGTRWNVNAVILGTHPSRTFLMPVAIVMRQYHKHLGRRAVKVLRAPSDIDSVASRTDNDIYVNLVNTLHNRSLRTRLSIAGMKIVAGKGTVLADDPTTEISSFNCRKVMLPAEFDLAENGRIELPPASVTSLKLTVA